MTQNEIHSVSTAKANEAAVLGSMILNNATIPKVLLLLHDESFLFIEHRHIFIAIRELWLELGRKTTMGVELKRIDALTVRDKLVQKGLMENDTVLDQNGGVTYLVEIMSSVPSAANAEYYASQVRETRKQYEIENKASKLTEIVKSAMGSDEKIQALHETILDLEPLSKGKIFHRLCDEMSSAGVNLLYSEELLMTGFFRIDQIISGFAPDDFVILGARPSMGKTSLALNIACYVGECGNDVLIFSKEMTAQRLIQRILCADASVDAHQINQCIPGMDEDRNQLIKYLDAYHEHPLPITIVDTFDTPAEIHTLIRQHRQVCKLSLVIVDYIQLLSSGHRDPDLRHRVTELSKSLKQITHSEGVPMLALSQLSRNPTDRSDFRPRMSDLRESGALEQDADIIMLLHREDYYHKADRKWLDEHPESTGRTEVIIDKNRNGPCGVAELVFCPEYCRFMDLSHTEDGDIPPSDKRDVVPVLFNSPEPGPSGGKGDDAA
ncbi:Replicative DNA helicase [subsurface metagenome]